MNMYVGFVRTYIYVCACVCHMHEHASVAAYRRQRMIFLTDACEDLYICCFFMYENIFFPLFFLKCLLYRKYRALLTFYLDEG